LLPRSKHICRARALLFSSMDLPDSSPCVSIKQWEEAGTSLIAALKNYMNMCLNLGTLSLCESAEPKDLVSRIDSTLTTVHMTMSHHLNESTCTLARTRNRLASLPFRFPEEVLYVIFMNVVYDDHDVYASRLSTMKQDIWFLYRRLYSLIGVCSTWRNIIMNRGTLWSVVPIVSNSRAGEWRPFELSLKRAGGSILHLATISKLTDSPSASDLVAVLDEHGPRFRTINISMNDPEEIQNGISQLLRHNTPGLLSELSIQCTHTLNETPMLPPRHHYIVPRNSPEQASFVTLVHALVSFRINGVHVHWNSLTFSTKLVELRIEKVALGYDDTIIPFMRALASATCLRDLKIISVTTFRRLGAARHPVPSSPVTFPALQSLLIEDLHLNTLEHLLPMITPGPHHLTLFLSPDSLEINVLPGEHEEDETEDDEITDFDGLCRLLNHTSVDTLMLTGHVHDLWLGVSKLTELLKSIPTMKTLKMHCWTFGKSLCKGLARVDNTETLLETNPMPALQNLYLSTIDIHSPKTFRDMIASYPLRQVVIGGNIQIVRHDVAVGWRPIGENSAIVKWIRGNMPNLDLRLIDDEYRPPEFHSDEWKLW
ncbi:unnamed protein product, partial [Rhizoctonia solani]